MSKKIFLSFLGTNNYLPCNYISPNKVRANAVRFVQEATIINHCADFDKFLFFLTKDAKIKNWHNNGFADKDGNPLQVEGLQSRLEKLNLMDKVCAVDIGEGFTNEGVWGIFQKIYENVDSDSVIVFDITHAFRFMPMLGMVLINYLKVLKNVETRAVYYGAFEALGSIPDVKNMPIANRDVEIIDLTNFSILHEWTNAANVFLKHGVVGELKQLCEKETNGRLIETSVQDQTAQNGEKIGRLLDEFSQFIYFVRGKKIIEGEVPQNLKIILDNMKDSAIPALNPILDRIRNEFNEYKLNSPDNFFEVVKWCIKNGLIQQGFTFLQEGLITFLASAMGENYINEKVRNCISSSFKIAAEKLPEHQWKGAAATNPVLVKKAIQNPLLLKLMNNYNAITSLRNDMNHAGMRNVSVEPNNLSAKLAEHLFEVEKIILQYDAHQPL